MAFKTHAAIMHLCRLGYREDAEAQLSTLFELALDLRHMRQADDQQECAQRWLDWAEVVQHRYWGVLNRGDDYYDEVRRELASWPLEMQEVLDAIERVKAKDSHSYTGRVLLTKRVRQYRTQSMCQRTARSTRGRL